MEPIRTSPHHPQTDGLVERLKSMLQKLADEDRKDWDRLLPYVLFAYREVPQALTGFSPFELVYRSRLDIIIKGDLASEKSSDSVDSYVLSIQEKLAVISQLVQENLAKAQREQNIWYDRNARERSFQPEENVLVLLPSNNKLLAQWQGPYSCVCEPDLVARLWM